MIWLSLLIGGAAAGLAGAAAAAACITVYLGAGHLAGFIVGTLAGAALWPVFAALVLGFRANQVTAWRAIGILRPGLSVLSGDDLRPRDHLFVPTVDADERRRLAG